MDEQQLTHPKEIQWYERQKQLERYLTFDEPAQLAAALECFLEQHAQLHSPNGLVQSALAGLSDEQWRLKPRQGTNSVAWLLLHMARIEDVTFNLLVMERAQVFDEWFEQLGFDRRDVGTGMNDEEVLDLSKTIHLPALRAYWSAVGKTTQDLARFIQRQYLKMMTNMPISQPFRRPAAWGELRPPLLLAPLAKGRSYFCAKCCNCR